MRGICNFRWLSDSQVRRRFCSSVGCLYTWLLFSDRQRATYGRLARGVPQQFHLRIPTCGYPGIDKSRKLILLEGWCYLIQFMSLVGYITTHLLPSTWYQVSGTKYFVPSTWYNYCGPSRCTKYLIPCAWYHALGSKYLVTSIWYQALGTKCLVPSTGYQVHNGNCLIPRT